MTRRPSVTLIVPTFNRSRYLALAVESLVRQTHPFDELLIVDDGSTDDTADVVRRLPGNPVYLPKVNGGRAAAINHGVRHAKGDLIWVFDDDDIALPNALALLIQPFLERDGVDFTYSPWYLCDELPDGALKVCGTSQSPLLAGPAFFHEMLFRCFTQGNAMLIARRCYDAIGPMREDLIRSQDHDYMLRLSRRFDAVPIAEPTFHWRRHLGPRGAGGGKMFSATKLIRNWHTYRQKIFVDLHATLPLQDYLPRDRQAGYPGNTREARLTRATVMAAHGLWDLALPELLQLAQGAQGALPVPLDANEQATLDRLATAVSPDALLDLGLAPRRDTVAQLDRTPIGRTAIRQILRAGRWHVHNDLRDGEVKAATRMVGAMTRAIGPVRGLLLGFGHLLGNAARPAG